MNEYYVYGWQDIDSGKMIYVGQGKNNRYKEADKNSRNRLFNEYIKTHEIYPFILVKNLTEEESIEKESVLVRYYKSIGQCCCNIAADGFRAMPGNTNPNYRNGDALKKRYREHPELKDATKHCGADNGRATPIEMIHGEEKMRFNYIGEAVKYLIKNGIAKASESAVRSAVSSKLRNHKDYHGYYFNFV